MPIHTALPRLADERSVRAEQVLRQTLIVRAPVRASFRFFTRTHAGSRTSSGDLRSANRATAHAVIQCSNILVGRASLPLHSRIPYSGISCAGLNGALTGIVWDLLTLRTRTERTVATYGPAPHLHYFW